MSFFSENPNVSIYTRYHFLQKSLVYIFLLGFWEKMTFFPPLNIFDAFELDVNVVNFVYYGKTRVIDS